MSDISVISVTIIICTYNRAEDLRMTLASLSQIEVPDDFECELVVVDNASTDHTQQVIEGAELRNLSVRCVHEPKQGQCHARNTAMAAAGGEILLWTDDDVRLPQDWIEAMCRPISDGRFDAMAGGVKMAPHLQRPWMTIENTGVLAETARLDPSNLKEMVGANMAFSRQVLQKVPAFDIELGPGALGFGDDTLFSFQLIEAGYKIGSCLHVCIEHHFDPSRLSRANFIAIHKKMGYSWAYIAHHWEHKVFSPWIPLAKTLVTGAIQRATRFKECKSSEGIPAWEGQARFYEYILKGHIQERKKPFKYDFKGLVKKNHLVDDAKNCKAGMTA